MMCPHGQERRGVNFSHFCADVLYGRPSTYVAYSIMLQTYDQFQLYTVYDFQSYIIALTRGAIFAQT